MLTAQPLHVQHSGAPLVIDVRQHTSITQAEQGAVALLELMLWGDPDAPLVGGAATRKPTVVTRWLSQLVASIKTASLHRLLILVCQRLRVEVLNVRLALRQEGHPGPWAASRHLECMDACEVSIRRLLVSPRAIDKTPKLHLLRRPFMAYYATDMRVAHTLEADLAGVDVAVLDGDVHREVVAPTSPGPFAQYTEAMARRPKRARNGVQAPPTPPPNQPTYQRHLLLQQWSASASLTVAPRGTTLQHVGEAVVTSTTTPGGLENVPEETDDNASPTTSAQLTICARVTLSAFVPLLTPAATASVVRIAERLVIFNSYAPYWARRPLEPVHDARRLWWKYAGAAVHEAARQVARRNVPLTGLAARHRLRRRHAVLYAAAHRAGGDAVRRLLAFEAKLTLEQVCNFRLMAGLRDSPYLRGSVPRRSAAVQVGLADVGAMHGFISRVPHSMGTGWQAVGATTTPRCSALLSRACVARQPPLTTRWPCSCGWCAPG